MLLFQRKKILFVFFWFFSHWKYLDYYKIIWNMSWLMTQSMVLKKIQKTWLKSSLSFDVFEYKINVLLMMILVGRFGMNEITSISEHASACGEKDSTFFGFIFWVGLLVFLELMRPMCKFTFLLIWAKAKFYKFFA